MKITIFPSAQGDCLLLEAKDATTILADGGMYSSYQRTVRPFLGAWAAARPEKKRTIDLLYVSHIDQDHIAGALQLLDDIVDWRVHRFRQTSETKPAFAQPPEIGQVWHNAFHEMVGESAGEIGSMLASSAALLSNSDKPTDLARGDEHRKIAASVGEAIKLSRRISDRHLGVPLNRSFGGKLGMVREPAAVVRLKPGAKLSFRVLGPFKDDLEKLRIAWDKWLTEKKTAVAELEKWKETEDERLDFAAGAAALDIDDRLGQRSKVTPANLASLMLLVEEGDRRVLLTGDGHAREIIRGLDHHGALANDGGIHVDLLKVQHHGSEHNLDRDFVRRVTADNYIFCGNGLHENPDLGVLQVLLESRLGEAEQRSGNAEVGNWFTIWFNSSSEAVEAESAWLTAHEFSTKGYAAALVHFREIEALVAEHLAQSPGRFEARYLDGADDARHSLEI